MLRHTRNTQHSSSNHQALPKSTPARDHQPQSIAHRPEARQLKPADILRLQRSHGNQYVMRLLQRSSAGPVPSNHHQGLVQRTATILKPGGEEPSDEVDARLEVAKAIETYPELVSQLPASSSGTRLRWSTFKKLIQTLLEEGVDHGTFDLSDKNDVAKLTGVLQTFLPSESEELRPEKHEEVVLESGGEKNKKDEEVDKLAESAPLPKELGLIKKKWNQFKIIRPNFWKNRILGTLRRWKNYFDSVKDTITREEAKEDKFKNFLNAGSMIDMIQSAIEGKDDDQIYATVRIAVNTEDTKRIAAIIVFSGSSLKSKSPTYVSDVMADPGALNPKERNPSFRPLKGSGNAILQHAVIESGPKGIKLWPLDDVTRRIYLSMDFDGDQFEETSDKHLVLIPKFIEKFANFATGALKYTAKKWMSKYPDK